MGTLPSEQQELIMPQKSNKEKVAGRFFVWVLFKRDGIWYGDGRSNEISAGKHSLGTRLRTEAIEQLHRLDLCRAVDLGLADRSELESGQPVALALKTGWDLYRSHVSRPRIVGGAKPKSVTRYKAVFDKFIDFALSEGIVSWNQVAVATLQGYAAWLDGEGYAYRTEYLELTTLKQAINWLQSVGHIPERKIDLPLRKPLGTDTYCWRSEEVAAIVHHCHSSPELYWLGDLVTALASTGLRISELASLRITDVDRVAKVIRLTDESTRSRPEGTARRETKNSRSRSFPICVELEAVLNRLPPSKDGLLFHGPRRGRVKPDTIRNILIRDVLKPLSGRFPSPTGTTGFKDGRLHSFRHYFCSQCATSGVAELAVMEWLGHQGSAMVRHYFHLHDQQAQEQMARVTFVSITGGTSPPADSRGGVVRQSEGGQG
jgi:integrase